MTGRLKNNSGFALILTLVVTALMVAVVVEMIHQVYVDTSLSRGFRDGQQASILAESGATGGAKLLQIGLSTQTYTSLSDRWATPFKVEDEVGSLEITISEESGKIYVNELVQPNGTDGLFLPALKRLGTLLEMREDPWAATADWIDLGESPLSGGAESAYYRTLKPPYSARNGRLMTLTELSLIKGFTPGMLDKLRPYLTIYPDQVNSPLVNINTASKEVLAALDDRIDARLAEQIVEERRLQPFKSTGELSRVTGMGAIATDLIGKISVQGHLFRIKSIARVKDSVRTVETVVRMSGRATDILLWQEY